MSNMQLALDHIDEMLDTHHVDTSYNMILIGHNSGNHRRIDIDWLPGKGDSSDLVKDILNYRKDGYRAYTIDQNGLKSHIRLARGKLTAVEIYDLILESRSLMNFNYDEERISMEFVKRHRLELDKFEMDQRQIMSRITDFNFEIGLKSFDVLINDMKHHVTFTLKDAISTGTSVEDCFRKAANDVAQERMNRIKDNLSQAMMELQGCKDCKDGYYYPLVGPREPCRTCASKSVTPDLQTFVQDVTDMFVKQLKAHMPGQTKVMKTLQNQWKTFAHSLNISKDYDIKLIALNAGSQMASKLSNIYTESIAFEDQLSIIPPNSLAGMIHKRSTWSGVSAAVSMHEKDNILQFQFQVKVST